jgi:hypothetical protein
MRFIWVTIFSLGCAPGLDAAGTGDELEPYRRKHDLAPPDVTDASPPPIRSDAGAGGALLKFAVFGDARPPSLNSTGSYPSAVITGIFDGAQAHGAQFVVGTGDYLFASTKTAVDAQLGLFLAAQAHFTGPVYHALGNHECNGYTSSNCPNLDETPNIAAFMSRLMPAGATQPYYRVDVPTPFGAAKFLFIAANAWSPAQATWLAAQLADPTTYTFAVRHEPPADTTAPGVSPSEKLLDQAPFTLELLGHTHEYRRVDTRRVISGNGGAPLQPNTAFGNYGYLLVEQQANGDLSVSEMDEATDLPVDTFRVTPTGQAAP